MSLVRLLVIAAVIYLLYRIVRWLFRSPSQKAAPLSGRQTPAGTEDLVEDPVCHLYLPVSQAYRASVDGRTAYFCSETCYRAFVERRKT